MRRKRFWGFSGERLFLGGFASARQTDALRHFGIESEAAFRPDRDPEAAFRPFPAALTFRRESFPCSYVDFHKIVLFAAVGRGSAVHVPVTLPHLRLFLHRATLDLPQNRQCGAKPRYKGSKKGAESRAF